MKRSSVLFLASLLILASVSVAQPAARESEGTDEPAAMDSADKPKTLGNLKPAAVEGDSEEKPIAAEGEDADGMEPGENEKTPLEGDVVVFKKGTELRGVKVVRESPMFVEIEYLPGEPYLQIPATQVKEVIYAEEAVDGGQAGSDGLTLGPDIMPGEEVSPEFHKVLTSVLSDEPLAYENEDYLEVIQNLCDKAVVEVSVDENLKALSKEDRTFSRTVAAGTTLLDFLRKDLAEIAPDVRVILHYDRLDLQKRVDEAAPPADLPEPGAGPEEGAAPEPGGAPESPADPEPAP